MTPDRLLYLPINYGDFSVKSMNKLILLALAFVPQVVTAQTTPPQTNPPQPTQSQTGQTITLEEALELAKQKQPSIEQVKAQVDITIARTDQVKAAQRPQVDLSASAGLQPPRFGDSIQILNPGYQGSVDLRWLFYDFGKTESQVIAAESATNAAQKELDTLYAAIIFGVAQSYYDLWVAQESVVLAEDALVKVKARVETAQALFDAGARPKIEVARASLDQANAEVDKARALGSVLAARTALAKSMGQVGPRPTYIAIKPPLLSAPPQIQEAIENAYQARPELAALEAQRLAQEEQIKVARLIRKPDLIGAASASLVGPGRINDTFIPLLPSFSAQVIFSMPILDGGASNAQLAIAQAQLRSIEAEMEQLRIDVATEIEDAYTAYLTAMAARIAAQEATKFAIENETLAKGRYEAGAGSSIEISDAQLALVKAQTFELQANAEEGLARLRIDFVLGQAYRLTK